ncbi:hypothetical protein FRC01_009251, partial [Tulasnella sp. 417]
MFLAASSLGTTASRRRANARLAIQADGVSLAARFYRNDAVSNQKKSNLPALEAQILTDDAFALDAADLVSVLDAIAVLSGGMRVVKRNTSTAALDI